MMTIKMMTTRKMQKKQKTMLTFRSLHNSKSILCGGILKNPEKNGLHLNILKHHIATQVTSMI